jgi:hypothetical protein
MARKDADVHHPSTRRHDMRTFRLSFAATAALATLVAVTACSSDSTSPNDTNVLDSQLSSAAAATAGAAAADEQTDLASEDGVSSLVAQLSTGAPTARAQTGCSQTGAPADLRFYCLPDTLTRSNGVRTDTIVRVRNYEYFADGSAQETFNASTDSIDFGGENGTSVYAAAHRARWSGISHRTRHHGVTDKTPSFAADSVRTWNGATVAYDTAAYAGPIWTVNTRGVAHDTSVAIVYWHPVIAHPYPQSGEFHRWVTWNYDASGPATRSGTVSRHIVVTFNGTRTASLQVIGATTLSCTLDLATGEVTC